MRQEICCVVWARNDRWGGRSSPAFRPFCAANPAAELRNMQRALQIADFCTSATAPCDINKHFYALSTSFLILSISFLIRSSLIP